MRRTGRRIVTTARGRELRAHPPALLAALAEELLAGDSFQAACAELAAALILDGFAADYSDALATEVQPAIVAEGWRSAGQPPEIRDVAWVIADFLRRAQAVGLLERGPGRSRLAPDPLVLTGAGRAAMTAALRTRALAPPQGPC